MTKSTNSKLGTEPYKGVRDFYPEDMAVQNHIFNVWKKTVESYGFVEYSASILEPAELYRAKSGQEIVNEQTYTFIDRGDREVTLRPEMTPSVARLIAHKRRDIGFPARWYSIPNVFRYERPQKGRLREHWQLNADIFGLDNVYGDIEMIALSHDIMKAFGAHDSDFIIRINSRKLMNAVFNNWYELDESNSIALQKLLDKKAKLPEDTFAEEAEKIIGKPFEFLNLNHHSSEYQEAMAFPEIRVAKEELDQVFEALKVRGIKNVEFDETIIRGFDYYTGIVFEVFDTDPENNRSMMGGGRYDDLLALFGTDKVSAVGIGMGDVTLREFLESRKLLPVYKATADVQLCIMDEATVPYAEKVAQDLRSKGITVALNYSFKSIGDQIKSAEKQHIQYVIILGEEESKSDSYKIKDLLTGEEVSEIKK